MSIHVCRKPKIVAVYTIQKVAKKRGKSKEKNNQKSPEKIVLDPSCLSLLSNLFFCKYTILD